MACKAENTGDAGLVPGSGRSPGEENVNPLQYSCLGNPMDTMGRGAWRAAVRGVSKESSTTKQQQNILMDVVTRFFVVLVFFFFSF